MCVMRARDFPSDNGQVSKGNMGITKIHSTQYCIVVGTRTCNQELLGQRTFWQGLKQWGVLGSSIFSWGPRSNFPKEKREEENKNETRKSEIIIIIKRVICEDHWRRTGWERRKREETRLGFENNNWFWLQYQGDRTPTQHFTMQRFNTKQIIAMQI